MECDTRLQESNITQPLGKDMVYLSDTYKTLVKTFRIVIETFIRVVNMQELLDIMRLVGVYKFKSFK